MLGGVSLSFRERMRVETSNAEMALMYALNNVGVDVEHHQPIFLCDDDLFVNEGPRGLEIFLDGQWQDKTGQWKGHAGLRQSKWDDLVNRVLNWKRQPFIRFPYTPPHRKKDLKLWVAEILEVCKK